MTRKGKGRFSGRHSSRRRVLQLLYAHELGEMSITPESMDALRASFPEDRWQEDPEFTNDIIGLLSLKLPDIDNAISLASTNWGIDRMDKVALSIIRSATAELMGTSTPARVVISEAIELAKEFGAEKTPRFVNGVLDKILRSL